jgi:hypothetical protein
MGRYYFRAEYNGSMVMGDEGEELPSLHAAKTHAAKVAAELWSSPSRGPCWRPNLLPTSRESHLKLRCRRRLLILS